MSTSAFDDAGREPGDVGDDADALPDAASADDVRLEAEVDVDDLALGATREFAEPPKPSDR